MMRVRNWSKFQHYKNRKPPWLRLYSDLLSDIGYHGLSPMAAKYLPLIWIVASEDESFTGLLPASNTLAFRLRLSSDVFAPLLAELLAAGFVEDENAEQSPTVSVVSAKAEHVASTSLAVCQQVALPEAEERRGETEESRTEQSADARRATQSATRLTDALKAAGLFYEISPSERKRWWLIGEASQVADHELEYAIGRAKAKRPGMPGAFVCSVIEGQRRESENLPPAPARVAAPVPAASPRADEHHAWVAIGKKHGVYGLDVHEANQLRTLTPTPEEIDRWCAAASTASPDVGATWRDVIAVARVNAAPLAVAS